MDLDLPALLASLHTPPWESIGRSLAGRPIVARGWPGAGVGGPVLLFGAIHGDEPLGVYCLARLAEELDGTGDGRAPTRPVWIVPAVNPDGLLAGEKNNARGVDLNRNWPAANWRADAESRYFPGTAPASEPETQALAALIAKTGARRLIALHSPFRTVNWDGDGRALAERMAAKNGYGATSDIGYPTPGSFGSLFGVDRQGEVITLEIPPMPAAQAWAENRTALLEALL